MTDRRKFLKTCGNIACLCGFGSILNLTALEMKGAENDNATSEVLKNEAFALHWITEILDSLKDSDLTDAQKRYIIKKTSMAHHDLLNVPEMVKPYIGKPKESIGFLQNAWGWKVTDDHTTRTLVVDENKPYCVFPLIKNSQGKLFPVLCYCSEGFAEKMFSLVYGHPVTVSVAASIHRGNPSCIYHIQY